MGRRPGLRGAGRAAEGELAVCFIAFDRPRYFRQVLESVAGQRDAGPLAVYCFLDGAVNPFSGLCRGSPAGIRRSAELFRRVFPSGELHASPHNLGVALNFDRAERHVYDIRRHDYAVFLEDDLVLQPHYFRNIRAMIARFGSNRRIGMFNAYGDHDASLADQERNRHRIKPMGHLWAFCLPRARWIEREVYYAEYLAYIRHVDYPMRSDRWIQQTLYRRWGGGPMATSQDGAKTLAMLRAGQVILSTYTNNAWYIGSRGTHCSPELFARDGYPERKKLTFPEPESRFEAGEARLDEIERSLRRGFLRPNVRAALAGRGARSGKTASPRVGLRGDWHSPSGFGEAARGVFRALKSAGLARIAVSVPKDPIQQQRLWRGKVSRGRGRADLWIHLLPPEYFDLRLPGKHAGFFVWETDRLPAKVSGCDWAKALSKLDEVWAPSSFVAEVLQGGGVTAPIRVVFLPVDTARFAPGPRRPPAIDLPPGFDPTWTVILYAGTWDARKRPDILVRSFCRAFTGKDNALLLIKSYLTGDASRDRQILERWISESREGGAHVRLVPGVVSAAKMADLFRFAAAFATASRGEGYCLPAVQAMSLGKPVVAPGWSAFRDYVTLPVDYRLRRIPAGVALPGYSSDQRWAVVDEDDLSAKLRWVHENRDAARRLGNRGREWVLENASLSAVGRRLSERIRSLCADPGHTVRGR